MCGVGRQQTKLLATFVLIPQTIVILLGIILFAIGILCTMPCLRIFNSINYIQKYSTQNNINTNLIHPQTKLPLVSILKSTGNNHMNFLNSINAQKVYTSNLNQNLIKTNGMAQMNYNSIGQSFDQRSNSNYKLNSTFISESTYQNHPYSIIRDDHMYNNTLNKTNKSWSDKKKTHFETNSSFDDQIGPKSLTIQNQSNDTFHPNQDLFELRIGLFCILYLIPLVCINACDVYEYLNRALWLRSNLVKHSYQFNLNMDQTYANKLKTNEEFRPNAEFFMLRIFMSLVTGFTCTLWMWTVKGCKPNRSNFHLNSYIYGPQNYRFYLINNFKSKKTNPEAMNFVNLYENKPKLNLSNLNYSHDIQTMSNPNTIYSSPNLNSDISNINTNSNSYALHPYAIYQIDPNDRDHLNVFDCAYQITDTMKISESSMTDQVRLNGNRFHDELKNTVAYDPSNGALTTAGYYSQTNYNQTMKYKNIGLLDAHSDDSSSVPPPLPPTNKRKYLPICQLPVNNVSHNLKC